MKLLCLTFCPNRPLPVIWYYGSRIFLFCLHLRFGTFSQNLHYTNDQEECRPIEAAFQTYYIFRKLAVLLWGIFCQFHRQVILQFISGCQRLDNPIVQAAHLLVMVLPSKVLLQFCDCVV